MKNKSILLMLAVFGLSLLQKFEAKKCTKRSCNLNSSCKTKCTKKCKCNKVGCSKCNKSCN